MILRATPGVLRAVLLASAVLFGVFGWLGARRATDPTVSRRELTNSRQTDEPKTFWQKTSQDPIAFFTMWMTVLTAGSVVAVSLQLRWMRRTDERLAAQIDLARGEFGATHRPQLRVRVVTFEFPLGGAEKSRRNEGVVQYYVVNTGATDATLIEVCATLHRERDPWPVQLIAGGPRFDTSGASKTERVLRHGEAWVGVLREPDLWSKLAPGAGGTLPPWHFVGYLRYSDSRGTVRRTGFCRRFDELTRRFVRVDEPDFDYTD